MEALQGPILADDAQEWASIQMKKQALAAAVRYGEFDDVDVFIDANHRWVKVSAIQAKKRRFAGFPVILLAKFYNNDNTRRIVQFSHDEYWVRPL